MCEKEKSKLSSLIFKNYMFLNYEVKNNLDLLEQMADKFYENGLVTRDYKESLIKREEQYPTGLKMESQGFAIPHTDAEFVVKPGVVFVQLKEPVEFLEMATLDKKVEVRIIFMLLMKNNGLQVDLLKDLLERCSEPNFLKNLEKAASKEEVLNIICEQ